MVKPAVRFVSSDCDGVGLVVQPAAVNAVARRVVSMVSMVRPTVLVSVVGPVTAVLK